MEYLNNDVKAEVNAEGWPETQAEWQAHGDAFLHQWA